MREGIPSEVKHLQISYFHYILSLDEYKYILCDSLNYCVEKKALEIFCFALMSTHLHLIARAKNYNLSDVVRDFKKYTSGKLINEIRFGDEDRKENMLNTFHSGGKKQKKKSNYQIWQYNNHAVEVYSPQFTLSRVNYIHYNPVEAGLVTIPDHIDPPIPVHVDPSLLEK